jgi:hypothetical protein
MNWIKRIINHLKSPSKIEEKCINGQPILDLTWDEWRKKFCEYTMEGDNNIRTSAQNFMQRVKRKDALTGWAIITLDSKEVKKRLDNGMCWLDYPVLDENNNPIEGMTGKNFINGL